MVNKPKAIGTAAESAVVKVMQRAGFPHAERRALRGGLDAGDITGIPGVVVEVKGGAAAKTASDAQVEDWLAETETERINAKADLAVLVVQRKGVGYPNADKWWAVVDGLHLKAAPPLNAPVRLLFGDVLRWLRANGYGTALPAQRVPWQGCE